MSGVSVDIGLVAWPREALLRIPLVLVCSRLLFYRPTCSSFPKLT